tara:strand:- start:90 stop:407 length:318 start_codon:yes stop_codon:yes gene_type:complete
MMDIIALLGTVLLLIISLLWSYGNRIHLQVGAPNIFAGMVFSFSFIAIIAFEIPLIYSWIGILIGYASVPFWAFMMVIQRPVIIYALLEGAMHFYIYFVRIGIKY